MTFWSVVLDPDRLGSGEDGAGRRTLNIQQAAGQVGLLVAHTYGEDDEIYIHRAQMQRPILGPPGVGKVTIIVSAGGSWVQPCSPSHHAARNFQVLPLRGNLALDATRSAAHHERDPPHQDARNATCGLRRGSLLGRLTARRQTLSRLHAAVLFGTRPLTSTDTAMPGWSSCAPATHSQYNHALLAVQPVMDRLKRGDVGRPRRGCRPAAAHGVPPTWTKPENFRVRWSTVSTPA